MEKTTRRKLLAAGVTTVAAGATAGLLGQDEPAKKPPYNFQNNSPRELKAYAKAHGAHWTFLTGKPDDILFLRQSLGFTYNNPKEDADRNNHSGMLLVADEPVTRWASCEGGAKPEWIATVIRTEADAPFIGSVNGVRESDPAVHIR